MRFNLEYDPDMDLIVVSDTFYPQRGIKVVKNNVEDIKGALKWFYSKDVDVFGIKMSARYIHDMISRISITPFEKPKTPNKEEL